MNTNTVILTVSMLALPLASAFAKDIGNIPQVGRHQSIVIVEKNVNPQNLMVVYTKVDEKCRFQTDPKNRDEPIFDFYWLMNGQNYKPVNQLIKNEIYRRFEFQRSASDRATHFVINVNDLKEMDTDIADPKLDVISRVAGAECMVEGFMNLGKSDGNRRIRLDTIRTEGRAFPPAVYSVTLKGTDVATGKAVERKYNAK